MITFITAEDGREWPWSLEAYWVKPWGPMVLLSPHIGEPQWLLTKVESLTQISLLPWRNDLYLWLVIASCCTHHTSMLLIGLACSRALIVVRASHFTDSNRLHRRIKMQSPDIDHQESTPLAKLTRQCIWIDTAFPSLGKRFLFPPSSFPTPWPVTQAKVLILARPFRKHHIKVHHAVSIVKMPGISLWIRGGKLASIV